MTVNEIIKLRFANERTQDIADDLKLSYTQVANRAYRLRIKKSNEYLNSTNSGRHNLINGGLKYRFVPGHKPHNKGKELPAEVYEKIKATMWKKGNRPHNWKPDGSIVPRHDADDKDRTYLYYKVRDSHWVLYHRKIWTEAYGPIPKGSVIKFIDGNTLNCDISNLQCTTMEQNMVENTVHRFPEEVKEVIRLNTKLKKTINGKKQN